MKDKFYFEFAFDIGDKSAKELDERVPGWRYLYLYPELFARVDARLDGGKMLRECRRKRRQLYSELNRARYARNIVLTGYEPPQQFTIDGAYPSEDIASIPRLYW